MNTIDEFRATLLQIFQDIPKDETITKQVARVYLYTHDEITGGDILRMMTIFKVLNDSMQAMIKRKYF